MHSLAERLVSHLRSHQLLKAGDRVGVAVSGGIDSVALLRLLLELRGELGIVLSVVHFNHKLRGVESEDDRQFVADLARGKDLDFLSESGDVAAHASRDGVSTESAARDLRYGFFRHLVREGYDDPQGLKPTVEPVERGPEGPLFYGGSGYGDADRSPSDRDASDHRDLRSADSRHNESKNTPSHDDRSGHGASGYSLSRSEEGTRVISKLDKIATGHTLDDQAETVLMRMIRGSGLRGIGGIHPRLVVEDDDGEVCGEIIRPLLTTRRCELEQYLNEIGQRWREDSTNADHSFTRNRVRRLLVPLIEKEFNPSVAENLSELAEIARGEEEYWDNEVAGWMGTAVHWVEPEWAKPAPEKTGLVQIASLAPSADADLQTRIDNAKWLVANASVSRPWLLSEPIAVQRRVVKAIGEHAGIALEFKHVEEILRFAAEEAGTGRELSLPSGWKLQWCPEELLFVTPDLRAGYEPQDYEYSLLVPGQVAIPESGVVLEVARIPADAAPAYNPDELLSADSLPGPFRVRNWRAGDRFWPAHTRSPKKIKELLQERHVPQSKRMLWPVVLSGDEIVWVRGFPAHAKHRPEKGRDAIQFVERQVVEEHEK